MVVALGIQHAMRMFRIISSSVAFLAVSYFYELSLKLNSFRKSLLNLKFVFLCSLQVYYHLMTVNRNRFLVNKTNRCTEFQFYWYY